MSETPISSRFLRSRLMMAVLAISLLVFAALAWYSRATPYPRTLRYAGSKQCAACHPEEYDAWKKSHHGLAERPIDPDLDRAAFDPPRELHHGSVTSRIWLEEKEGQPVLKIRTTDETGQYRDFEPERVIGVAPLRQLLVRFPRGQWQATALAYDPVAREWFDVFGDEDRKPHEWGYWTNRGMTWNSMCATCHVTNFQKNYRVEEDRYESHWTELAVGCEACHGPAADHVRWQREHPNGRNDPTITRFTKKQWVDTCGACHARRSLLLEPFRAGEAFLDQFTPVLPDLSDTYYPDGQVREENYEYVSFLLSRMYHEGVTCMDCHDPHTGKRLREGNNLCLKCHASKINPAEHTHHRLDGPGGRCENCHMPITVYMQRHPRRDHGFTIPDPLLTIEYGIPNACNRCHEDKSPEWALEAVEKWYGDRMDRVTRRRAVAVARARRGDITVIVDLLRYLNEEPYPAWRAVFALCLRPWREQPQVAAALVRALDDESPLVRWAAAAALNPERETPPAALQKLLDDKTRAVRVQAAWALRAHLSDGSPVSEELRQFLTLGTDQPTGCMMMGVFMKDRGNLDEAEAWFRRALRFEPRSPVPWEAIAVMYSEAGRPERSIEVLEEACQALPQEGHLHYLRGLGLAEVGKLPQAVAALEKAVQLMPDHARAWYNLGLARHRLNQPGLALRALQKAIDLEPENPDFTFALAAVYRDLGRRSQAVRWAERTLELDPLHRGAAALLEQLRGR